MTPGGALADFFKQYTNFRGTSSRSAFNWGVWFWGMMYLTMAIVIVAVAGLGAFFGKQAAIHTETKAVEMATMLVVMISFFLSAMVIIPTFALNTRRMHDMGYSGWWQIGPFSVNLLFSNLPMLYHMRLKTLAWTWWVPIAVSFLFALWLSVTKSSHSNRYR